MTAGAITELLLMRFKFITANFSNYLFLTLILYAISGVAQDFADMEDEIQTHYYILKKGDSLYKIANFFDLGFDELLRANPDITNPRIIIAGKKIILPFDHILPDAKADGIVINLAESRLYFFLNQEVISFPISIGADEKTPTGQTTVIAKRENPSWIPPASIREENPNLPAIVLPGPNNPLGNYAIYLDGSRDAMWQRIMIHGTNAPWTIGSKVSHGCIRLYPKDIEKLFSKIEIGTKVTIVNQPIKVVELNDAIYLEVHFSETPEVVSAALGVKDLICKEVKKCENKIDWQTVDDVVLQNLGIPTKINRY